MNDWEQIFTKKMEVLRAKSASLFDRLADEKFVPAFNRFTSFVAKWDIQTTIPQSKSGMRSFKFALAEDGYVLVFLRLKGVDRLECEYECWLPGSGKIESVRSTTELKCLDAGWVDSCFQVALDNFITKFSEICLQEDAREPVLV